MFKWKISTFSGTIVVSLLVMLVMSCDEVERYRVLSFFFDGVPPLVEERIISSDEVMDANSGLPLTEGVVQGKRVERAHGPSRSCKLCHQRLDKSKWATPQLTKRTPEICYDCHDNYAASASGLYVHGPVAVGACDFCHDPHTSSYDYLLIDSDPELCYRCHNQKSIESIPAHTTDMSSGCRPCHEAHSSSKKKLLRP